MSRRGPVEGVFAALLATLVVIAHGVAQGLAPDETHRVERRLALLPPRDLVDRDDVRVLELAGELGFLQKPLPRLGVLRAFGADLLEGHVAVEVVILGDVDAPQSARCVQSRQGVALAALQRRVEGGHQDVARRVRQRGE